MTTHPSYTAWLLRAPFAAVFLFHGAGKQFAPAMSADMLGLPIALVLLVGLAEVLAGLGALLGGLQAFPRADLVTRLSGLAAAPVLLGAIATPDTILSLRVLVSQHGPRPRCGGDHE
jgi:uncharacterized membrane protein YphA (DoxX/SURF4 family)